MTKSLQLLIASMNADQRIFRALNATESVIVANQETGAICNCLDCDNDCRIISTNTRGVGINRNIALLAAEADIVLFGDDDMKYEDNYREKILEAFKELPNADMIIFNLKYENSPVRNTRRVNEKAHRVHLWNALNYGAPRIAIKLERQRASNIWFSLQFGGGAKYNAGEDCIFVADAIRNGLKVYVHPAVIASTNLADSTWFNGYDYKFYFDKGALFKAIFPKMARIMCLQYAFRHKDDCQKIGITEAIKTMFSGCLGYRNGRCYDD